MAYLYLDSTKTKHVLSDQEALIKELNSLLKQVDSVRSGLRHKIACRATSDARLLDTKNQINLEMQRTTIMRDAFTQIIALYQQTEKANLDRLKADKAAIQKEKIARQSAEKEFAKRLSEFMGRLEPIVGTASSYFGGWGKLGLGIYETIYAGVDNFGEDGLEPFSERYWIELYTEAGLRGGFSIATDAVFGPLDVFSQYIMGETLDSARDDLVRQAGSDVGWIETVSDGIADVYEAAYEMPLARPIIDFYRAPMRLPEIMAEWAYNVGNDIAGY